MALQVASFPNAQLRVDDDLGSKKETRHHVILKTISLTLIATKNLVYVFHSFCRLAKKAMQRMVTLPKILKAAAGKGKMWRSLS